MTPTYGCTPSTPVLRVHLAAPVPTRAHPASSTPSREKPLTPNPAHPTSLTWASSLGAGLPAMLGT